MREEGRKGGDRIGAKRGRDRRSQQRLNHCCECVCIRLQNDECDGTKRTGLAVQMTRERAAK